MLFEKLAAQHRQQMTTPEKSSAPEYLSNGDVFMPEVSNLSDNDPASYEVLSDNAPLQPKTVTGKPAQVGLPYTKRFLGGLAGGIVNNEGVSDISHPAHLLNPYMMTIDPAVAPLQNLLEKSTSPGVYELVGPLASVGTYSIADAALRWAGTAKGRYGVVPRFIRAATTPAIETGNRLGYVYNTVKGWLRGKNNPEELTAAIEAGAANPDPRRDDKLFDIWARHSTGRFAGQTMADALKSWLFVRGDANKYTNWLRGVQTFSSNPGKVPGIELFGALTAQQEGPRNPRVERTRQWWLNYIDAANDGKPWMWSAGVRALQPRTVLNQVDRYNPSLTQTDVMDFMQHMQNIASSGMFGNEPISQKALQELSEKMYGTTNLYDAMYAHKVLYNMRAPHNAERLSISRPIESADRDVLKADLRARYLANYPNSSVEDMQRMLAPEYKKIDSAKELFVYSPEDVMKSNLDNYAKFMQMGCSSNLALHLVGAGVDPTMVTEKMLPFLRDATSQTYVSNLINTNSETFGRLSPIDQRAIRYLLNTRNQRSE